MKIHKITLLIIAITLLFTLKCYASTIDEALDEIPTRDIENYINEKSEYFRETDKNINK